MAFNILFFIIFIMLSAFFSLSETAIFSLSNLKLRRLQEKYSQGSTVKNLLSRPTHTLSAINFGNTLVNIGITSLSTALFVNTFGDKGLFLAIFISSILILFLGEIFPKTFAIYLAEKLSLFCAPVLSIFSVFFFPFVFVIEKIVMFFSSLFTWLPIKTSTSYEELKTALILSRKEGHISAEEEEMVSNVLEFKDTWVSEIMNPRIDIHGIDIRLNQQEVLKILREKKHSKFPVYEGSLDNITAMLYAKDIFLNPSTDWHLLLKTPLFIPATKRIDELLKVFLEKQERIAIVLDEYGGTEGLVTLEDIQEEIFGEIYDEFETPREPIEKIEDKTYRLHGKIPIKTLNLELGLNLVEEQDTIAGFLLSYIGRIPHAQEKFYFKNLEFTIERATVKRIISIILKIA